MNLREIDALLAQHVMGWNCRYCDCSFDAVPQDVQAIINSSGVRIRDGHGERWWRPTEFYEDCNQVFQVVSLELVLTTTNHGPPDLVNAMQVALIRRGVELPA